MRDRRPEVMDDPGLDPAEHRRALAGLARLNAWSRSAAILWPAIRDLAATTAGRPVRVLDVATGAGDVPIALWQEAHRAGIAVAIRGCDVSPIAVAAATARAAQAEAAVTFVTHDALREPLPGDFDAATCSLFLHHLSDDEAVKLLTSMAKSARLVLVNDLARGPAGLALAWVATRLLTRSRVVHVDGPRSVRAAFTSAEALRLAERAGMIGATVERRWPCRFLLCWRRDL